MNPLEKMGQQLLDEYVANLKRLCHRRCSDCTRFPLRCIGVPGDLSDDEWYEDCEENAALCHKLIHEGTIL